MHQALYRKWRPQTFDDVYGQDHITSVLRYEASTGAFSHAYLFCGSRGTGKTTCAKILAKVVNCHSPINGNPCGKCEACQAIESGAATDVLEMDAASNNGVENIRDIRDEVVYSPSSLRYRVYIIDEVHMLSISAFNALLKTLEEPPEHVIFILATTELQKLPATIISRCQRFDFRRIATTALVDRLTLIAKEEEISLKEDAARLIARLAQGGMRDAISLLELCAGVEKRVSVESVQEAVGITGREALLTAVNAVADRNYDVLLEQIANVVRSSKDLAVFWQDLTALWRDMLIIKTTKNAAAYLDLTDYESEQMQASAARFSKESLLFHCRLLEEAYLGMLKSGAVKRIIAELTLVRMCDASLDSSNEALLARVAALEERLSAGEMVAVAPQPVAESVKMAVPTEKIDAEPPKKEVSSAQPAPWAEPKAGAKRVLHPIRNWMEVVERISRNAPMTASFVKGSRAFTTEEGKVIIRFDNAFAQRMMEEGESRDRLRSAVCTVLRREVGDRDLVFETVGVREEHSPIDEIIEASQN